ncbi:hypothetical protein PF008_g10808 [Phytophthora fragariae]|uniref:PiggyBac transposable element-derived protein 4 C-terminal zinc-ribbon domain-containing protein n=1 Tax=Phytophthora fragariae TaxID=53985 RepID=A0A6G0RU39_9STRA|nr:hypothetical protein PF008_g10808 [Phytophthora fragariae]
MRYGCQSGPDRSFKNLRTGEHPVQSPRETRRPRWAPHDIDFGHLWRQLRAAGWTSKRPTGIQTQWAYKSPEGENVLLGERAVVEYAFKSGLLVEDEEHVGEEDGGGGHVGDEGGSGEHVEEEGGGGEHGEEHKRRRAPVRLAHALEQSEDWVTVTGVRKRCQRSCKVCALLRTEKKKSFATTFFCERCSIVNAKCWLCNKIRRDYKGVAKTCFEIWHDDFGAGQDIPVSLGSASCCAGPTRAHESARRRAGNYSSPARKEATAATVTLKAKMSERAGCVSVGEW